MLSPSLSDIVPGYPALTLGTLALPSEVTVATIHQAIALGYRAFDTAPIYGNETEVGEALRSSPVSRDQLFVTTKLWNSSHGYDDALAAFDRTAIRLGMDTVDLYLIHWPVPMRNRYVEAWMALVRLREEGRVRAIGVSNFLPEHLDRIIDATGVVPAVNQIEVHPTFQQRDLRQKHRELGIVTQAWAPLGSAIDLAEPSIVRIAEAHGCSPAQAVLRWHTQQGTHPVAKAGSAAHLEQNLQFQGSELTESEELAIAALDGSESCYGVDPSSFVAPVGMEDFCP